MFLSGDGTEVKKTMRRAERLFRILQHMRKSTRTVTAQDIAEALEVSVRTIYRDIAHLVGSGVPIDGEAGVGYLLRDHHDLPPMTFTFEQLEALVFGAKAAAMLADDHLATAAQSALDKIEAVLPPEHAERLRSVPLFAVRPAGSGKVPSHLSHIREAVAAKRKLKLTYRSLGEQITTRTIRPLGLTNFGAVWLAIGWCELRDDFRNFRIDRIEGLQISKTKFKDEAGKTLADYFHAEDRHRPDGDNSVAS